MNTVFILTGGNIGQRLNYLHQALTSLAGLAGVEVVASSSIYETAAWGLENQASFFNQVLQVRTTLPPQELLQDCLAIELAMGRERKEKNGPRTIDIDLLLWDRLIIKEPRLQLPHPRMAERRFVLSPLAELAGACWHPVHQCSIDQLLAACPDPLPVHKLAHQPPWAAAKFAPVL